MIHVFDTDIAIQYGVNAAVLLQNIGFWIKQNEANGTNFYDGTYWTYNSRRAYRELFPYMSERQIDTAFRKLIDDGLLITGNYNKLAYDRTLWYALTQKGKCILHFDGMESTKLSDANPQNVKPIPDINTNKNTNINTDDFDECLVARHIYLVQLWVYLSDERWDCILRAAARWGSSVGARWCEHNASQHCKHRNCVYDS